MKIQIGNGYYGITTLPSRSSGARSLSNGFQVSLKTPLPKVNLFDPVAPVKVVPAPKAVVTEKSEETATK